MIFSEPRCADPLFKGDPCVFAKFLDELDTRHYADSEGDEDSMALVLRFEFTDYVSRTPMSSREERALRKWVSSGHSVYENPGSRYYPHPYIPWDFLSVYREDRAIAKHLRGKLPKYVKFYKENVLGLSPDGWDEREPPDDIESLSAENMLLWHYLSMRGLEEEGQDYVSANMDTYLPF